MIGEDVPMEGHQDDDASVLSPEDLQAAAKAVRLRTQYQGKRQEGILRLILNQPKKGDNTSHYDRIKKFFGAFFPVSEMKLTVVSAADPKRRYTSIDEFPPTFAEFKNIVTVQWEAKTKIEISAKVIMN